MFKANKEIVKTLYAAKCTQSLKDRDSRLLDDLTPRGFKVSLDSHSTATHCRIFLCLEGEPELLVWYKTNWDSSSYEFNEKGKTIGLQKNCEFIEPKLIDFFEAVDNELQRRFEQREAEKLEEKEKKKEEKETLIDKYRASYS